MNILVLDVNNAYDNVDNLLPGSGQLIFLLDAQMRQEMHTLDK